jgi:hypothetical protein
MFILDYKTFLARYDGFERGNGLSLKSIRLCLEIVESNAPLSLVVINYLDFLGNPFVLPGIGGFERGNGLFAADVKITWISWGIRSFCLKYGGFDGLQLPVLAFNFRICSLTSGFGLQLPFPF